MQTLLAAMLLLVPALSLAAPPPPAHPLGGDPELQALHREIAALKLDRTLNLTREQARTLLPILRDGEKAMTERQADHERRKPQIVRALSMVRDDLRRDGKVSDAAQKALKEARGDEGMKQRRQGMKALREKAASVLTAEQKLALQSFDPRPLAGGKQGREEELGGGGGPGRMHKMAVLHAAMSAEFLALTEARAR